MSPFCCPVCRLPLHYAERTFRCQNGHCFDAARSGYVNLLRKQQSHTKRHGDDKRMLLARRDFLNRGHYQLVCDALCDAVKTYCPPNGLLADTGCGEGYYTVAVKKTMPLLTVCGIDISKDALQMTASRSTEVPLAVASVFSLPLADSAVDAVISVFAPCCDEEFFRVLKHDGTLIRVVPTSRHLYGLKAAIYPEVRLNKPEKTEVAGLTLTERVELHDTLTLTDPDDIRSLFEMTPYYYKTGQADQERLLSRDTLETEIGFSVLIYQKQ